jgi:hypothetical protein
MQFIFLFLNVTRHCVVLYRNDERNEKKKRVCTRCFIRLRKIDCSPSTEKENNQSMDPPILAPSGLIVKPSPIGGNGMYEIPLLSAITNIVSAGLFASRYFQKGEQIMDNLGRILVNFHCRLRYIVD